MTSTPQQQWLLAVSQLLVFFLQIISEPPLKGLRHILLLMWQHFVCFGIDDPVSECGEGNPAHVWSHSQRYTFAHHFHRHQQWWGGIFPLLTVVLSGRHEMGWKYSCPCAQHVWNTHRTRLKSVRRGCRVLNWNRTKVPFSSATWTFCNAHLLGECMSGSPWRQVSQNQMQRFQTVVVLTSHNSRFPVISKSSQGT